ncbi:Cdc6/Cdc18 family protein [Aeromonas veronii]|uniref:hypothetical protein n=1 Tax=Aeromonas veronii TaxID=654 RepID=UPI00191FD2C0|nr:hypothetical protein [Aeromonas veronii]MBL0638697.1 hypothetical protein [Aeromonas veronii]
MFNNIPVKSIKDWYPVLNWNKLPNFGSCHTAASMDEFKKNYYLTSDIATIYTNICETLENSVNATNVRISGDPGAGKTSFLYAIKKMSEELSENPGILSRFCFYIFHINKADNNSEEYKNEISYHVKEAWKQFYQSTGQGHTYTRFKAQNLSIKDLINKLSDYYKDNKQKFGKTLIFIVDDVDLLPGEHVGLVVENIIKCLEINSVKKWLVIRKVTFDNYSAETKLKIEQFFPDPYSFPTISLKELADYRIKNTCDNASPKHPFKVELCDDIILPICDGSLREGLSLLKSLLEENHPGKFKTSTDESVISNYIDNCAVKTLLSSQKLIDLHARMFRITLFPIAIDLLACARYHSSINILFGAVSDCLLERNIKSGYLVGNDASIFKLREVDFKETLNILVEHGLLIHDGKNRILLTDKGKITSSFSVRDFYFEYCKQKTKLIIDDEHYWTLSEKNINHKDIVDTFLVWKNNRS